YDTFGIRGASRHLLRICRGNACYAAGGEAVLAAFEKNLGLTEGETSADKSVTLTSVNCLGYCGVGPALECDGVCIKAPAPECVAEFIEKSILASPLAPPFQRKKTVQNSPFSALIPIQPLRNHVADRALFGAPAIVLRNMARNPKTLKTARAAGIYDTVQN